MTKVKRLVAVALAFLMMFSSISVAASAYDPNAEDRNNVKVWTEIFRTEADGDVVATEKVKKGETVKIKVYAETGYYTNGGTLLFFYNNDFFDGSVTNFKVGSYYSALPAGMTATANTPANNPNAETVFTLLGIIDQDFASNHDFLFINYSLKSNAKNIKLNGDQVLFEMDLKVKSDVSADKVGKFFIKDSTVLSSANTKGVVNIPKGPFDGYVDSCYAMDTWNPEFNYPESTLTLFSTPNSNPITVTFDTDGGEVNGKEVEIMEGEPGDAIEIADPVKDFSKFAGWLADGASTTTEVTSFPSSDVTYTAQWDSTTDSDKYLAFKTEFYRFDGNDWIKTDRVKRGEEVRLRVFVDTSYYTNAGEIMLFYDKDFFINPSSVAPDDTQKLTFNDDPASSAAINGAHGSYMLASKGNFAITDLIDYGYIDSDFADEYGIYTISYSFNPATGKKISGDKWFAEIPMIVSPEASGEGDCFIEEKTLQTPSKEFNYINIPVSDAGLADEESEALWLHNINFSEESNPVSLDSKVTFKANGGEFAEGDANEYVVEGMIGDAIDATLIPEISKLGSTFLGWAVEGTTEIIDVPTEIPYDDLVLVAQWISKVEITIHPNNGEPAYTLTVTPNEPFEALEVPVLEGNRFLGWTTDENLNDITGLDEKNPTAPRYPTENKDYYAVFETKTYKVSYYVLDAQENKFVLVCKAPVPYGDVISSVPTVYDVPAGYELSPAYTDITFKTAFVDGTTMPANDISLYYTLKSKVYDAIFDANGGKFADGAAQAVVPTAYEGDIIAPAAPVRDGYTFIGWSPAVGMMDTEGKTFTASWDADDFTAEYYVDGILYEAFPVEFEDSLDVPADPGKEGYEFIGWADVKIVEPTAEQIFTPEALAATTVPYNNVQYKAMFKINTYTATFDAGEGAQFPEDDDADVTTEEFDVVYGEAVTLPKTPVKTGYTFTGWTDENGNAPGKMPADDTVYTAGWEATKYTLTFIKDTTVISSQQVAFGTALADLVPDAAAVAKEGYTFLNWSPAVEETMPANDVVYIATYKIAAFDATFNAGAGTFAEAGEDGDNKTETVTTNYNAVIEVPALAENTGYVFAGWATKEDATEADVVTVPTLQPAEPLTYYAVWVPATDTAYEVLVYMMGTDGEYGAPEVLAKTGTTGEPAVYTPENITGFYVDDKKENVFEAVIAADGSTDLVVYYARETVKITFAAGAEDASLSAVAAENYLYGSIVAVPTATRDGYEFAGWALATDLNNVVEAQTTATTSADYVATWTAKDYTVTYLADGVQVAQDTIPCGNTVTMNAVEPTKVGYTFAKAWTITDDNGAQVDYVFGGTMGAENIILNAKFNPNPYDAVFYKETTDTDDYETVPVNYDAPITAPATNPTKQGYTFAGWSTNGAEALADLGNMDSINGKKFYAVWTPAEVDYKVEHYKMDTKGEYTLAPEVENLKALTDSTATAVIKNYKGFTQDMDANLATVTEATVAADGSTVLKVYYERNKYTLTINKDNGEAEEVIKYYFEEAVATVVPEYEGHDFVEWVDADENSTTFPGNMPAEDVYVKAIWEVQYFDVVYMNGTDVHDSLSAAYGDPVPDAYADPSKAGYEFAGWLDADGKKPSDYTSMPAKALTFNATWEAREDMAYYTEIYKMDENGDYKLEARAVKNDGVTLETVTLDYTVPAGFHVDETKENLTEAVIPETGIITLVVYLARNEHVLSTTVDDATTTKDYIFGAAIDPVADPLKEGYDFLGWFDKDGNKVEIPGTMDDADIIVTAKYEIQTYDAVFNAGEDAAFPNGKTSQTIPVDYNQPITAPDTEPVKEGYDFEGWSTDGSTVITDFGKMGTDDVEYKPVWKKLSYTVNYNVLNPETMATTVVDTDTVEFEGDIAATPANYTVPDGFTMSDAYTDAAFTTKFDASTMKMPAGDFNLYYKLSAVTYTITFVENGANEDVADITAAYGEKVAAPAQPTKNGFKFLGWFEDGATTAYVFDTMPLGGTTLTAKWEEIKYTITFDENGGSTVTDIEAVAGADISVPATAQTGYEFLGWYKVGTNEKFELTTMPAENIQLIAKWEAKTYTATFNTGADAEFPDGTTSTTTQAGYGENVAAPADPIKEGNTFAGWVDENGKPMGTMPENGATYTPTWTVNSYTLIFVKDGKELVNKSVAYGADIAENEPAAALLEKEGYKFAGWTGYTALNKAPTMPAHEVVYYATYEADKFTATFNSGDGKLDDGTTEKVVTTVYGEEIDVPSVTAPEGYDFAGWTDTEGSDVIVPVSTIQPAEELTYYAVFVPSKDTAYQVKVYTQKTDKTYDVVVFDRTGTTGAEVTEKTNPAPGFHVNETTSVLTDTIAANGGTVLEVYYDRDTFEIIFDGKGGATADGKGIVNETYLYGQTVSVPVFTRIGYEFAGWDKDVVLVATAPVTYNAQWNKLSYTVTYMADGAEVDKDTFAYGDTVVKTDVVPTLEGHEFSYWYENDESLEYTFGAAMEAKNIVLTAKFAPLGYTASFYKERTDTEAFTTVEEITFGTTIETPDEEPTKQGYTFAGWSTDGINKLDSLGNMDETGKSFYAVWVAASVKYKVEHYLMNATGDYSYAYATDNETAPTGTTVNAVVRDIEHYDEIDAEKSILSAEVAANGSTTLKVYYVRNQYTLTVDKANGTQAESNSYYFEQAVPAATGMEYEGHRFSHWINTATNETVDYPSTLTADLSIKAVWIAKTHSLTYNILDDEGNVAEVAYSNGAFEFGTPIHVPAPPSKVGYEFAGWFTADGKQPSDYGTMPDKDLVFNAVWAGEENVGYKINIYEMDVTGVYPAEDKPTTVLTFSDGIVGETRKPTITVPTGFVLDLEKSNIDEGGVIPATGVLVLKAYLERNQWTLTTVVDGAEKEYKFFYQQPVSIADPDVAGTDFLGWFDSEAYKNAVTIDPTMPNNDITVYAKLDVLSYNVKFDAGEGIFKNGEHTSASDLAYGADIEAPAENPNLEGHTFGGWALSTAPDVKVEDFGKVGEEDVTYVAIWTKSAYSVKFYDYSNERGPAVDDAKYLYDEESNLVMGAEIPFPAAPSINNYVFKGWAEIENDVDNVYAENATMPARDLVLYAVYERVEVKLIPEQSVADCTTVIDRNGLDVGDYDPETSRWYVYGLVIGIDEAKLHDKYIDVQGDGTAVVTVYNTNFNGKTGTGTVIDVYDNVTGKIVESFHIVIFGDLNGDARVDSTDDSIISDEIAGTTGWSRDDNYHFFKKAADLNNDSRVNVTDGSRINSHVLGSARIIQIDGSMKYA